MGRPRSFDESTAVAAAAGLFATHGYEGTSVDDLVRGLGIHRGSLYSAFGSKRALYLRVLREHVDTLDTPHAAPHDLTLLLRAAVERAPVDPDAAALVRTGLAALGRRTPGSPTALAELLGRHLIARAAGPAVAPEDT
jgi:AcrR family transcriptional regulator